MNLLVKTPLDENMPVPAPCEPSVKDPVVERFVSPFSWLPVIVEVPMRAFGSVPAVRMDASNPDEASFAEVIAAESMRSMGRLPEVSFAASKDEIFEFDRVGIRDVLSVPALILLALREGMSPSTRVAVAPKAHAVDPKVTLELARAALVTLASAMWSAVTASSAM